MSDFSFIQMADPQFGMFASSSGKTEEEIAAFASRGLIIREAPKVTGFTAETVLFTKAIERANWLRPAFVVICGDMVNEAESDEQTGEVKRVAALLDDSIDLYWVPGNHDVAFDHELPTPDSLEHYRQNFGADYYAFSHDGVHFIVVNSTILTTPETLPHEAENQLEFVESECQVASDQDSDHVVLLSHHPLFIESPDEADNPWSIKSRYRKPILEIVSRYGITANFAGHWHKNNIASANGIEVIASGPVGYPLGNDPSGFRVVEVSSTAITHEYHSLETP